VAYSENQTSHFSRLYKKLGKRQLVALHEAMDLVIKNPKSGQQKVGDLSELFVFKYKLGSEDWLLGYTLHTSKKTITWHAVGHHENFYRDVKRNKKG
jgi:mRNA-degrading endonuclease RelE of RelBE toxin-antitoxin system